MQKESRQEHQMAENAFLDCTSPRDSGCGCRCALGGAEYHSLPFDAPGAIPFACRTAWVIRVQKQRGCPPLLTWCGAIAAYWQLQTSPRDSPPEGGASIRPHDRNHPLPWVPKAGVVPWGCRPSDFEHSRAHYASGGTFNCNFSPFY